MNLRRRFSLFIEKRFERKLVHPRQIWFLFEDIHLRKLLDLLRIDCVFDVGANAGQYASKLRNIGYSGSIISYEPIPYLAKQLRTTATTETNWHVEQLAMDVGQGLTKFHIMKGDQFSSLLRPDCSTVSNFEGINEIRETIDVTTTTLEVEYNKYKEKLGFKRPFLKMDTQGKDHSVVQGGGAIIRNFAGLQSELAIKSIYLDAPNYHDALNYYCSLGFALSALVPNNEGNFPDLIEMDCILYNPDFLP